MRRKSIVLFSAVLAAGILCFSCEHIAENLPLEIPQPQEPVETGVYILTVPAEKAVPTKALTEAETTILASWASTDKVKVYDAEALIGELTAAESATVKTTLSGEMRTPPSKGTELTLVFCSNNYDNQDGTLEYISANCDYATATVTVTEVSGNTITTTSAHFVSQQAIVKFTLQDSQGAALAATQLQVGDGTKVYTVNTVNSTPASVFFVALPAFSDQTVTLRAQANDGGYYDMAKTDVSFENGTYYRITAKLSKQLLRSVTTDLEPQISYFYGGAPAGTSL